MDEGKELKRLIGMSDKTVQQIADIAELSRAQIYLLYKDPIISDYNKRALSRAGIVIGQKEDQIKRNMYIIPLKAVGGFVAGYANKAYLDSLEKVEFPDVRGECYRFEVEGFSMYISRVIDGEIFEVGYKPGTHVVATKLEGKDGLTKNKEYVFQTTDGLLIKRFDKIKDDRYHLISINNEYNPVPLIPSRSVKGIYFIEKQII